MSNLSNLKLRKNRIRAKVSGTAEKPRLSVLISDTNISAQLINDIESKTLASASTIGKKMTGTLTEKAEKIGEEIASTAKKLKIKKVVFDRNGREYAQRLKALADAARKGGLEF